MQSTHSIIHACTIEGDGKSKELNAAAISGAIKDAPLTWVHLDSNAPETRSWLERELPKLDSITIDALLAEETRPRFLEFGEGALLILRGVNLNENAEPEDMISIRLWADKRHIISVQRRPSKAVHDIRERIISGRGPKNTGEFITTLFSRLFERMEPVFSELSEKLDDIEEMVMETPETRERQLITSIRKKAIMLRRYIVPQRDVIAQLRTSEQSWLDPVQKRRLQETLDQVIRYIEDLDAIRERAQIVKDELANSLADRLNKNMYVLSVIAAVFLPLGFLTGLLGVNVGGIPGAENSNAFYLFCGMLLGLVGVQVYVFKKFRWL